MVFCKRKIDQWKSCLVIRWLFSFITTSSSSTTTQEFLNELGFTLGEQFEKHEFDVEFIDLLVLDGIEYSAYKYLKAKDRRPFNLKVEEITLYYNCDILMALNIVIIHFTDKDRRSLEEIYFKIKERIIEKDQQAINMELKHKSNTRTCLFFSSDGSMINI